MKASIIKNNGKPLNKFLIFAVWMALWQGAYLMIGQDLYVPSPYQVFMRLQGLIFQPFFWRSIGYSVYRVVMGFFISIGLGLSVGIISSMNRYVHDLIRPLVIAIKSTPVMSFIIIALLWFTSGDVPIFICFLMCFPIVWTNVVEGMRNVDGRLLEMAKAYRVKKALILKRIYIPSMLPYFFAACTTSLGLGWKVSVAAEVLSHPRNAIGSQLYSAKVTLDSADLFAWTFVVILLSMLFESLFERLVRRRAAGKESTAGIG